MIPAQIIIIDEIEKRLGNINTSNGYTFNVEKIKREKINDFSKGPVPIIFITGEDDTLVEQTYDEEVRNLKITISAFLRTRDIPFIDMSYNAGADIKTAINRSVAAPKVSDVSSFDLGGIVDGVKIDDIIPVIGEGQAPFCGVLVPISVEYKIANGDSYTIII